MIRCTIGMMAHNEERNVVPALCALLDQELDGCTIDEIIVIASGCIDRTVELARHIAAGDPRVTVDVEPERTGKAAAVNRLIKQAKGEVIVLSGADTLPDRVAISSLVAPLCDPAVGMTGAQVVPVDTPDTVLGRMSHMLWRLHHLMALRRPKLGEMVAFRNVIAGIPPDAVTDEVALEAEIHARGYRLVYAPAALVFNRGPQTLHDFLLQRRRIYAGHLALAREQGYAAASLSLTRVLPLAWELLGSEPRLAPWIPVLAAFECYGRLLGKRDASGGRKSFIWPMVRSTKQVQPVHRPLAALVLECRPNATWSTAARHRVRGLARETRTMLWWNDDQCRLVFVVRPAGNVPASECARIFARDVERAIGGESVLSAARVVAFRGLPSVDAGAVAPGTVALAATATRPERATARLVASARRR